MPGQLIGRDGCPWDNIDPRLVVARQGGAVLIRRTTREGEVVPDMFHVIPVQHITRDARLPVGCTDGKWMLMQELYSQFPHYRRMPLTRYTSDGYGAGQRLEHWHEWIWFRTDSTELGPYGLYLRLQEAEAEVARLRGLVLPEWLDAPVPALVDMQGTH
jgi:hypothetical protein